MNEHKTIRINGIEKEIPSDTHAPFQSLLDTINKTLNKDNQVISSVCINGQEITEKIEEELKDVPLENIGKIEIFTKSPRDLAYETLDTLDFYIEKISINVLRAGEYYKRKNLISGDQYFSKAIDSLDLFVQTIGAVKIALKIGLNQKIALTEASLVSTMNDLLGAKRENNYVFLAELLEKDLIENLSDWKNIVFPIMRAWKTV